MILKKTTLYALLIILVLTLVVLFARIALGL